VGVGASGGVFVHTSALNPTAMTSDSNIKKRISVRNGFLGIIFFLKK
jgi:hypothetical protein